MYLRLFEHINYFLHQWSTYREFTVDVECRDQNLRHCRNVAENNCRDIFDNDNVASKQCLNNPRILSFNL